MKIGLFVVRFRGDVMIQVLRRRREREREEEEGKWTSF